MPVKIQGKQYYTVAERVNQIHHDYPNNVSIETQIISHEKGVDLDRLTDQLQNAGLDRKQVREILTRACRKEVVVNATVTVHSEGGDCRFTDYAHERENITDRRAVNATSYIENTCTSAIGRALAAAGRSGCEYASADEIAAALEEADGDLIKQIRSLREQLQEARETEAALKCQIRSLQNASPPDALKSADAKVSALLAKTKDTNERVDVLMHACREMVGQPLLDQITELIPRKNGNWTKAQAILLLAICNLHRETREQSP